MGRWREGLLLEKLLAATITFAALLLFAPAPSPAAEGDVTVTAIPIASFGVFSSATNFGNFTWRGGLSLESDDERFGGFSGLLLSDQCSGLLAVTDKGSWFSGTLTYDAGLLKGLTGTQFQRLRDGNGKLLRREAWADAEALARLNSGMIGVAFERRVRFGAYDLAGKGLTAPMQTIRHPRDIDRGPYNGEVESFGQMKSGEFIAIAERQRDDNGDSRAWLWQADKTIGFSVKRYDGFNITDLAILPDGSVLTLERRFNRTSLPGMAVRRFSAEGIRSGDLVTPELLLEASVPLYAIDNMEGIAVCERNGETRVTLMSDNNFTPSIQTTVLLQFAYRPE